MKVKFIPDNKEIEIQSNETVLSLATKNDIHIQSVCKGIPSCAECRVNVVEGMHNVVPPSTTELSLIGTSYFIDGRRLSCQLRCFGDVTVNLQEQIDKQEQATKRPRGKATKTESESKAVMGTLILAGDVYGSNDEKVESFVHESTPEELKEDEEIARKQKQAQEQRERSAKLRKDKHRSNAKRSDKHKKKTNGSNASNKESHKNQNKAASESKNSNVSAVKKDGKPGQAHKKKSRNSKNFRNKRKPEGSNN